MIAMTTNSSTSVNPCRAPPTVRYDCVCIATASTEKNPTEIREARLSGTQTIDFCQSTECNSGRTLRRLPDLKGSHPDQLLGKRTERWSKWCRLVHFSNLNKTAIQIASPFCPWFRTRFARREETCRPRVNVRLDCNRLSATWEATADSLPLDTCAVYGASPETLPILPRCYPGDFLEGPIEPAQRIEAGVVRDINDLFVRRNQLPLGMRDAVTCN